MEIPLRPRVSRLKHLRFYNNTMINRMFCCAHTCFFGWFCSVIYNNFGQGGAGGGEASITNSQFVFGFDIPQWRISASQMRKNLFTFYMIFVMFSKFLPVVVCFQSFILFSFRLIERARGMAIKSVCTYFSIGSKEFRFCFQWRRACCFWRVEYDGMAGVVPRVGHFLMASQGHHLANL